MKKFGTPGLAAPGSASENVGSFWAGGWAWESGTGVGEGVGVGTLPVSDCVFAWPEARLASLSTVSLVFCLVLVTGALTLPVPPDLPGVALGVGVGVAVAVGSTVTTGGAVAVGEGVLSVEPRSTIDAIGAGSPGIWIWSTGVPGGMSAVTVICWPVTSVTR